MNHQRFFPRRLLLAAAFTTLPLLSRADIVIVADSTLSVHVAEVRDLSFEGDFRTGNLLVNYTDGTTQRIPVDQIREMSIKADAMPSSAASVSSEATVAIKGNILFVKADGGHLAITDLGGRVHVSAILSQGTNVFSLAGLSQGVYVLNVNGRTMKFRKK